jgi:hypothetical protein
LLLLAACAAGEDAVVLAPEDGSVSWNASFNGVDDRAIALVPMDVMVYAPSTGAPVAGAEVAVTVSVPTAALVLPEGLAWEDAATCGGDDASCGAIWDAVSDDYVTVGADGLAASRVGWTDDDGLVRLAIWMDAFPVEASAFQPIEVEVVLDDDPSGATFSIEAD